MKYLWYINLFFAACALLNAIRLNMIVGRTYKRKIKLTAIERVIHFVVGAILCLIPVVNIGVAFLGERAYMLSFAEDDRYERRCE